MLNTEVFIAFEWCKPNSFFKQAKTTNAAQKPSESSWRKMIVIYVHLVSNKQFLVTEN